MTNFANRLPTGPGSRGGHWHEPKFRRIYHQKWRAAHPEYREREKIRRARGRASIARDPAGTVVTDYSRPLPEPAVTCVCECGCREAVVVFCGFCREGQHQEETA